MADDKTSITEDRRCGTCRHVGNPEFDRRGNLKKRAYRCIYPIVIPALPYAVIGAYDYRAPKASLAVWPDTGTECATWEASTT